MPAMQRHLPEPMVGGTDLLAMQEFEHLAQRHTARLGAIRQPLDQALSTVSRTRGRGRKAVVASRDQTSLVTGQAFATDNRTRVIDHTGRGRADLPLQGAAAIADAPHSPIFMIRIDFGDT